MQRILVCDDERHILRLIQVNLERQGYVVDVCDNGATCLQKLRESSFDLLIIDELMGIPSTQDVLDVVASEGIPVRVCILRSKRDNHKPPEGPFGGMPPLVISRPLNPVEAFGVLG